MNLTLARDLAAMIQVAYAQYRGTTAPLPYDDLVIEETLTAHENGVQVPFGFVASETTNAGERLVYVVLRGTCSVLEWLDDGFIVPVAFPNFGNVAAGMAGIYRELAPQIVKTLKRVATVATKIFITGHSLGAALAHLAAADIFTNLGVAAESYTFCGPRVGDPAFARAFAASRLVTWRIFNTEDVVPTVPLATTNATAKLVGVVDWVLRKFDHGSGEYEHVGTPVPVTFQNGSIEGNHALVNVVGALA